MNQDMPFTFSHPSLFLPLIYGQKKWFSLTALVIGSMVPDFEYFIRMKIQSDYSHTFFGIFWFDLPLTILLAFVFHNVVRTTLYKNLPYTLQARLVSFDNFAWNSYFRKNWFIVIISSLIGVFSHLLWDSFTHETGYFVQKIPFLNKEILSVPGYKIVQHLSSLLGALVIIFIVWRLPKLNIKRVKVNFYYWLIFALIVVILVVMRILCGLSYKSYGNIIATTISASLIALIAIPIILKILNRKDSPICR